MWKKRLIATVTFIAGLYFFLEYVVPPMVPARTRQGVIQSVRSVPMPKVAKRWSDKSGVVEVEERTVVRQRIDARLVTRTVTVPNRPGQVVRREGEQAGLEEVRLKDVRAADRGFFLSGRERRTRGVVLEVTRDRVDVGVLGGVSTIRMAYQRIETTLWIPIASEREVTRTTKGDTPERVTPDKLKPGDTVTFKWRPQKGKTGTVSKVEGGKVLVSFFPTVIVPYGRLVAFRTRSTGAVESAAAESLEAGELVRIGPTTYLSRMLASVNNFLTVLGAMAWGMGLFSLWLVHSMNIRRRRPEWYLGVIVFVAIGFGAVAGYGFGNEEVLWARNLNDVVFEHMLLPMGSTVFSLLAFYMASAAYRSFKAKSSEAILMMVSALIIMLGQIPVGMWLTEWLGHYKYVDALQLPKISQWILYGPSSAAVKGMWFGMMLGAIAVGLRFWLSLERGAFFDREM